MKKIISLGVVLGGIVPSFAFAVNNFGDSETSATTILNVISELLFYIIPILVTLAVVYFIWGVIQYTLSTSEETKKGARGKIIQGLIGLFIIICFWGIISVISKTFGVGPAQLRSTDLPCIPNESAGIDCGTQ